MSERNPNRTKTPPRPPQPPLPQDCCGSGCEPCVYDIYERELAAYERAMTRWRQEQGQD